MKFTNLEKMLPFGYLILVILGILKESVFYYQIGINILKYSNLMDILISPISDLTAHPAVLIGFLIYVLALYAGCLYASKNTHKNWVKKLINTNNPQQELDKEELEIRFGNKFLQILTVGMMSFFLGIGVGNGQNVANKIAKNNLNYNHAVTFNSDETKQVYLIGSNTANFFYIEKGNNHVKISPVGAVKAIEFLKK
jgi:hypothetical protein